MRHPKDKNITIVNPVMRDGTERLQELLRLFFDNFAGRPTLYIIDDCSATKELTKKKRHAVPASIFWKTRRAKCLGHFAEIYFGLEGPPGAGKVGLYVLHQRQRQF